MYRNPGIKTEDEGRKKNIKQKKSGGCRETAKKKEYIDETADVRSGPFGFHNVV